MKPEDLLRLYGDDPEQFRRIVENKEIVGDELLFNVCRMDLERLGEEEQRAVGHCFLELMARYDQILYNICRKVEGNEEGAIELRSYVIERLEERLGTSFFPSFEPRREFQRDFSITLVEYIRRYFFPDYHGEENPSDKTFSALGIEVEKLPHSEAASEGHRRITEGEVVRFIKDFIQGQTRDDRPHKYRIFPLFCEFPTREVRESTGDEKIHDATRNGVEERTFEALQKILVEACLENEERIRKKVGEDEIGYEELIALYWAKLKILKMFDEEMPVIADLESGLAKIEKCQKKYARCEDRGKELRGKMSDFLQLSYPTLGRVLNTTLECCYKWRSEWKDRMWRCWRKYFIEIIEALGE